MGKINNTAEAWNFDWSLYEDGWNGTSLKVNKKISTRDKHCKIYSHESYAKDLLAKYLKTATPLSKELRKDTLVTITDFHTTNDNIILASVNGGANDIAIDLNKEQRFFNTIATSDGQRLTKETFLDCLKDPDIRKAILDMGLVAKIGTDVEKASIWDGYVENLSNEMKEQIVKKSKAYIAKVLSTNNGGFIVEVADTIKAFMPGSMAAANKLTDYAALVGQTMEVMVESYDKRLGFVVSRKKFLQTIAPTYTNQVADLVKQNPDVVFGGKVTGTTPFGVFIELEGFSGCLTGMIHKSLMSDQLREDLRQNKVAPDTAMNIYVHKITREGKNVRLIFTDVPSAEREAVIARREAEDAAEKSEYVNAKKNAAVKAETTDEAPADAVEEA